MPVKINRSCKEERHEIYNGIKERSIMIREIMKRKSVRTYTEEEVTREELEDLLRAGMQAPSACNTQNWKFIATNNLELVHKVGELPGYYGMAKGAGAVIIAMGEPGVKFGEFTEVNVAATIENILLEATSIGLGAVWCAIHPMEERIAAFRELFAIEEKYLPIACIVIGHTDDKEDRRDTYDPEKVIWK